jgi:group I intron endonuclease
MRYVYIITNQVNRKVYVGQSKDPKGRKAGHWRGARKNAKGHLYDAMRKHGLENFTFQIIEECTDDLIDERESWWIAHHDSINPSKGYNKESGGHANKTLSEETKRKLSEANKGVIFSPERCANIAASKLGVPNLKIRREANPERAKSISETLKGRPLSEEHKRATAEGVRRYVSQRGEWHLTDEARKLMSEAQKRVAKKEREAMLISDDDPRVQARRCEKCGQEFWPKRPFMPWRVNRHQRKRWCTRRCALMAHNETKLRTW